MLFRNAGGEVRVLLRDPVDELSHAGIGQKCVDVESMTLQFRVGKVRDQGLLANGMHGHYVATAPAFRDGVMPDGYLA